MELEILSKDFRKILKHQISGKILPAAGGFLHAERQTDIRKLIVAFRHFTNALKHLWPCRQQNYVCWLFTAQCSHYTDWATSTLI